MGLLFAMLPLFKPIQQTNIAATFKASSVAAATAAQPGVSMDGHRSFLDTVMEVGSGSMRSLMAEASIPPTAVESSDMERNIVVVLAVLKVSYPCLTGVCGRHDTKLTFNFALRFCSRLDFWGQPLCCWPK